jgi:serine/threonine protein kinase
MSKSSQFLIGDFIIDNKRIGKGSFATIHKGYHKSTQYEVAIKKQCVDNIFNLKKQLKREISFHKKLNHPNIVKLYDIFFDNESHIIYFIMELCTLGDFSKFQKKRPIKEFYIQKYTKQLSNGLNYLINNNIIHRDLKPQNLLIDCSKNLKISDFGFAKSIKNLNNEKLKQTFCGSPMYMAPEILHYEKYNEKSDLWSVGIIIYEMITGKPPYHVKNFYQLVKKMDESEIIIDLKYKKYLSIEIINLVQNLLIKDTNKRISWKDFFTHPWIMKDLQLERENKLLEINCLQSMSLPNEYLNNNDIFLFDDKNYQQNINQILKLDIKIIFIIKLLKIKSFNNMHFKIKKIHQIMMN